MCINNYNNTDNNVVLCGRGNRNAKNSGNVKFTNIIRSSVDDYVNASTRMDKAIVVASVASFCVNQSQLEFMKYDKTTKEFSIKLSMEKIHDKCSHAIRDYIKQSAKVEKSKQLRQKKNRNDNATKTNDTAKMLKTHQTNKKRRSSSFKLSFSISEQDVFDIIEDCCDTTPSSSSSSPLSDFIFDLGTKIENTTSMGCGGDGLFSSIEADEALSSTPLSFPNPAPFVRRVTSEHDDETMADNIPSSSSSSSCNVVQSDLPLPVDSITEFEDEDIERIFDILGQNSAKTTTNELDLTNIIVQ